MRLNTKVTFAMRDLDRLRCIQAVVDGDLKPIRAAEREQYADFGPTLARENLLERHRQYFGELTQIDDAMMANEAAANR
jgi:hypothetical protein